MKSSVKLLLATFALLVAGCVETQPTTVSRDDVGPGSHQVDGITAMWLFEKICVQTSPKFTKTRSVIAALPFVQHPETSTYYHSNLDLSVKLITRAKTNTCSMVFSSNAEPMSLAFVMTAATGAGSIGIDPEGDSSSTTLPNGARMHFQSIGRTAGKNYYKAAIIAAK